MENRSFGTRRKTGYGEISNFFKGGARGTGPGLGAMQQTDVLGPARIQFGRLCRSMNIDLKVIEPLVPKGANPLLWITPLITCAQRLVDASALRGKKVAITEALKVAIKASDFSQKERLPLHVAMQIHIFYGTPEKWMELYVKPWSKQIYSESDQRIKLVDVEKIVRNRPEPEDASQTAQDVLAKASRSLMIANFDQAIEEALKELGIS